MLQNKQKKDCYKDFEYFLNCKDFVVKAREKKLYANNFDINNSKFNFAFYIVNNILFTKIFLDCLLAFVYKKLI